MLLNRERALRVMSEKEVDALITTSESNNTYFSDIPIVGSCVFPETGEATLIAGVYDASRLVATPSWIGDVRFQGPNSYDKRGIVPSRSDLASTDDNRLNELVQRDALTKPSKDLVEALLKCLNDKGLHDKKLGFDLSGIDAMQFQALTSGLPEAEITDATQDISWIRAVKTQEEIDRIKNASRIMEDAFDAVEEAAGEGMTEEDLAAAFRMSVAKERGVDIRRDLTRFLGGSRSAFTVDFTTNYKLRRGDLLHLHGWLLYRHYICDLARNAVVGNPSNKQLKLWRAIVEGQEKMLENVRIGAKASELFDSGLMTVRDAGIPHYDRRMLGHGIGLGPDYDPPLVGPKDGSELEENMVLCIETPYFEVGFGGINLEDIGLVTKQGFKGFMRHRPELRVV